MSAVLGPYSDGFFAFLEILYLNCAERRIRIRCDCLLVRSPSGGTSEEVAVLCLGYDIFHSLTMFLLANMLGSPRLEYQNMNVVDRTGVFISRVSLCWWWTANL